MTYFHYIYPQVNDLLLHKKAYELLTRPGVNDRLCWVDSSVQYTTVLHHSIAQVSARLSRRVCSLA
jgi:hypothetical protein